MTSILGNCESRLFQALVELSVACERIGRFVNKLHANCMLPLHLGSNHPRALECLAKRELQEQGEQDAGHKFRRSTYVRTPPKFVTSILVTNFGGIRTYVPASWSQISAEYVRTCACVTAPPNFVTNILASRMLVTNFGGVRTYVLRLNL